jgi:hypothetical protein
MRQKKDARRKEHEMQSTSSSEGNSSVMQGRAEPLMIGSASIAIAAS